MEQNPADKHLIDRLIHRNKFDEDIKKMESSDRQQKVV
jgi:hypothetical protein